jgi:hypothetical protein
MIPELTLGNLIHGFGFLGYWLRTAVLSVLGCSSAVHIVQRYQYNLLLLFPNLCLPFLPRYIDAEVPKANSSKA